AAYAVRPPHLSVRRAAHERRGSLPAHLERRESRRLGGHAEARERCRTERALAQHALPAACEVAAISNTPPAGAIYPNQTQARRGVSPGDRVGMADRTLHRCVDQTVRAESGRCSTAAPGLSSSLERSVRRIDQ